MRRILITGGAGFIGSHLCDRLIALGNYVLCVDNFFTGVKCNVARLIGNPYLVFRPLPSNDPLHRQPNITLTKEKLSWEPKVCLTAIKLSRHSGMDRRNPDRRDANNLCHPWSLGSGDPCTNDEFFLNLTVVKVCLEDGLQETIAYFRKILA